MPEQAKAARRQTTPSVRYAATRVVLNLLTEKASLATGIPYWSDRIEPAERPLLMELSYGVSRWSIRLSALMSQLMDKPLRQKDQDVAALLQVGLYQLCHTRIPAHATINMTVEVTRELNKKWAKGLVNAVLRNYQRQQASLDAELNQQQALAFPPWLAEQLTSDWPIVANELMRLSNAHPPMILRVNQQKQNVDKYMEILREHEFTAKKSAIAGNAIILDKPVTVSELPGFDAGQVSVQDTAAQLAAELLAPADDELILDACAAPGGKTGHILELAPGARVVALDIDSARLQRVDQNAQRLSVAAQLTTCCADAAELDAWWDGQQFDAILLDAPCSGTGVLRRHPDIKLLRRASDIDSLKQTQYELLQSLWKALKPGGRMLYVTCSQLKEENERQMENFANLCPGVQPIAMDELSWGELRPIGRQLLLNHSEADGFYYCLLRKTT